MLKHYELGIVTAEEALDFLLNEEKLRKKWQRRLDYLLAGSE